MISKKYINDLIKETITECLCWNMKINEKLIDRLVNKIYEKINVNDFKLKPLKLKNCDLLVIQCENKPNKYQMKFIEDLKNDLSIDCLIVSKEISLQGIPQKALNRLGYFKIKKQNKEKEDENNSLY